MIFCRNFACTRPYMRFECGSAESPQNLSAQKRAQRWDRSSPGPVKTPGVGPVVRAKSQDRTGPDSFRTNCPRVYNLAITKSTSWNVRAGIARAQNLVGTHNSENCSTTRHPLFEAIMAAIGITIIFTKWLRSTKSRIRPRNDSFLNANFRKPQLFIYNAGIFIF